MFNACFKDVKRTSHFCRVAVAAMDASEKKKNRHRSYNSKRGTIGVSRYRKIVLRYFYTVLRCIAILCFHYIFSKIQLNSQYLPSFEPYVIESELYTYVCVYMETFYKVVYITEKHPLD